MNLLPLEKDNVLRLLAGEPVTVFTPLVLPDGLEPPYRFEPTEDGWELQVFGRRAADAEPCYRRGLVLPHTPGTRYAVGEKLHKCDDGMITWCAYCDGKEWLTDHNGIRCKREPFMLAWDNPLPADQMPLEACRLWVVCEEVEVVLIDPLSGVRQGPGDPEQSVFASTFRAVEAKP